MSDLRPWTNVLVSVLIGYFIVYGVTFSILVCLASSSISTHVRNMQACDETISRSDQGAGYRGCQDKTRSGRTCQAWTSQSPHTHAYRPSQKPGKGLGDHNYCRNPDDGETGIWCYTTDQTKRTDTCDSKAWLPHASPCAYMSNNSYLLVDSETRQLSEYTYHIVLYTYPIRCATSRHRAFLHRTFGFNTSGIFS